MSDAQILKSKSKEGQKVAFHVFIMVVGKNRADAMVFGIPLLIIIVLLTSTGTCHFQSANSRIRCV